MYPCKGICLISLLASFYSSWAIIVADADVLTIVRFDLGDSFYCVFRRVIRDWRGDAAVVTYDGNGRSGYAGARRAQDQE